jgi:hypothetical protein
MVSSGMLHCEAVVRTDVSEELTAFFIRVTGIGELGTTPAVTHYISTTEPSRLMLCKILGFHCGDYEEWCLLGYYTMRLL